jgi:hypothetical protein
VTYISSQARLFVVVTIAGLLTAVPASLVLTAAPSVGQQLHSFTFYGMADWDGDGHTDIVGRNTAGDLMLYPGEGRRGYSSTQPIKIGNGW